MSHWYLPTKNRCCRLLYL